MNHDVNGELENPLIDEALNNLERSRFTSFNHFVICHILRTGTIVTTCGLSFILDCRVIILSSSYSGVRVRPVMHRPLTDLLLHTVPTI
jgi:hypothetical protein